MIEAALAIAEGTGARITHTDDPASGVDGVDFVYTDVWVSMGEEASAWGKRIEQLLPYQVNRALLDKHREPGRAVPALPAGLPQPGDRWSGEDVSKTGLAELEVTEEVFESGTRSCSTRRRTGCTPSRRSWSPRSEHEVRIVIALGGNALLPRGQRPDWAPQVDQVARVAGSLAQLAAAHEVVLVHGNGPQVGLLALESAADPALTHPYPLDELVARRKG